MMEFSDEIIIQRSVSEVWPCLLDIARYPLWYPGLSAISGRLAEGESLRMELTLNGRKLHPSVTILHLQPETELVWHGSLFLNPSLQRLFSITRSFQLEACSEQQTRFVNREIFSGTLGRGVAFMIQARLRPRYRQLSEAFMRYCESREAQQEF